MSKWIWAAIVIVILVIAGIYFFNSEEASQTNTPSENTDFNEADLADLQTSEDVFNEIDSSIDSIE